MQFRDTAQRGGAATETERAHPGRSGFQRPKRQLVHETLELVTRCGQDGRAPQNRRGLRRFGPILIDYKSALQPGGEVSQRRTSPLVPASDKPPVDWALTIRRALAFQVEGGRTLICIQRIHAVGAFTALEERSPLSVPTRTLHWPRLADFATL